MTRSWPKRKGPNFPQMRRTTALRLTGVDDVKPLAALAGRLAQRRIRCLACHLPPEGRQMCQDTLRSEGATGSGRSLAASCRDLSGDARPAVSVCRTFATCRRSSARLRQIKSPAEIAVMRRAGRITALAVAEAMRSTAPGLLEGQLGAIAEYVFQLNGASGGGYRPIIAGGNKHLEHALLPQQLPTCRRRAGAHGLCARLLLLHERHRPHVAGQRDDTSRGSASCMASWSTTICSSST